MMRNSLHPERDELDLMDDLIRVDRTQYRPHSKAQRVHLSTKKVRLLRGGLGSGKTRCGTEHVNALALQYPRSLHLIARKDITSLKTTTQKEFLEKVVPPEVVATFNKHENNLIYKNGSMVIFRETKDPQKVLSLELTSWLLDETTENDSREIVDKLEQRLRQKININGREIAPPYAGLCIFNPPAKTHWLHELSLEENVDDIQFSTYENRHNLPDGYIEDLERRLPPWERKRLLDGEWGIEVKGKPVVHGFTPDNNVRLIKPFPNLPALRGWDFGYGHPCVKLYQFDPWADRIFLFRELLGDKEKLNFFAPRAKKMTEALFGTGTPIIDWGDPHGADQKDVGESSIEYLRLHHQIHVNYRRQRIKTGIEEIQERIISKAPTGPQEPEPLSKFVVHPSCEITIAAYMYGYHQDETGTPVKDGYFDHVVDCDRYVTVGNRNLAIVARRSQKKYVPRNRVTGY